MLYKHRKLSEKRSFSYQKNKTAKIILFIGSLFVIAYLMMLAVMMAMIANDSNAFTSVEFLMGISPFLFLIDFLLRFIAQQTPAQLIKPYVLLPIPKYTCIDSFIGSSLFSSGNFIWFSLLLPYVLMSVVFSYGILVSLGVLLLFIILLFANSQWYTIVRTLINDHLAWWLLPFSVYALVFAKAYIGHGSSVEKLCDFYAKIGTALTDGSPIPFLVAGTLLALVIWVNRKLQYSHVMKELACTNQTTISHIRTYTFLSNWGELGKYIQLEMKLISRNKNPRKSFIFATAIILAFSLAISFTDIYDEPYYSNFFCLYNYAIFGSMILIKIMCHEANFIDCLMVRKENILQMLQAKYLFYSTLLLFPFLLMLPTVFTGKWSLFMLISYAVFTMGVQYFIFFQMAVYNTQASPLNTKLISKAGMENNYFQVVVEMGCLFVPMAFVSILQFFWSNTASYFIMLALGIVFIATHRLWLRNIYHRMMKKKYQLLSGYHSSRA